jgi:hypothetical protein
LLVPENKKYSSKGNLLEFGDALPQAGCFSKDLKTLYIGTNDGRLYYSELGS